MTDKNTVILAALLLGTAAAIAVLPPGGIPRQVVWRWAPDPADLGGMSTNDYETNIVFRLYSVTDCTLATNVWPEVTNWQAASCIQAGGWWTNTVTIDGATRFYLLSVGGPNGARSPFSNPCTWIPVPPAGTILRVGP